MQNRKGACVELDLVYGMLTDGTVSATICHRWVFQELSWSVLEACRFGDYEILPVSGSLVRGINIV